MSILSFVHRLINHRSEHYFFWWSFSPILLLILNHLTLLSNNSPETIIIFCCLRCTSLGFISKIWNCLILFLSLIFVVLIEMNIFLYILISFLQKFLLKTVNSNRWALNLSLLLSLILNILLILVITEHFYHFVLAWSWFSKSRLKFIIEIRIVAVRLLT